MARRCRRRFNRSRIQQEEIRTFFRVYLSVSKHIARSVKSPMLYGGSGESIRGELDRLVKSKILRTQLGALIERTFPESTNLARVKEPSQGAKLSHGCE